MKYVINDIVSLADKITALVKDSDTYREYVEARVEIMKQPELVDRLRQFKRQNMEYQAQLEQGIEDFDKEKYLSQEYYKLRLYNEVAKFIDCERTLIDGLAKLYERLFDDRIVEFLV
jgi:cell fate (sporulation/competence/biofilm development) regulator YlbF (YheA/YmcA/DUF963 family)